MRIDYTFNPWWGCTRVSPGCDHCYAEALDARTGGAHWGKDIPRRTFGDKYWARPLKWDADARKAGERAHVFCASMADVFDAEAPEGQLERLWALVRRTALRALRAPAGPGGPAPVAPRVALGLCRRGDRPRREAHAPGLAEQPARAAPVGARGLHREALPPCALPECAPPLSFCNVRP